ncbi:2-keto-4-pentenoate hydratase [Evansella vedderi]|uniref:2-keto-4-pentenoate hydratase n=1 Tax=Evansella vedderi TaxID=38282 RepID=A0ABU0A293_9BACI|nr:2-keto-4-pentenoate hydratase [Evansella vedderi]MDQ0257112.1 2-keto-4-pentenoate hydratase [Evansella vedderi]
MDIQKAANALLKAEITKQPIEPFTSSAEEISADDAYLIQLEQIRQKVEKGAVIVGKKIGLTSKVMQEMFNVNEPDYGHILDNMVYKNGETVLLDSFLQPRVEFEIAFVLKKDLTGPNVTVDEVIDAVDYIVPAIEIIDSRIKDWKFKYEDTVADNGSSGGAIVGGKPIKLSDVDLPAIRMNVYRNGELMDTATAEAVMGNPLHAVAWLANALSRYDISLHREEIILSGALSKAVPIQDGDTFIAEFDHIGAVSATFKEGGQ